MKTKRLIQIVVSYSERDGIGSIITGIHNVAHAKGIQSHIVSLVGNSETKDPDLSRLSALVDDSFDPNSNFETQFIYHFGFSNEFIENFILLKIPKNKCFYYHNVTPAEFFSLWDPPLARQLMKTRTNMKKLFNSSWKITGDSHYNINELNELTATKKLPPTIPEDIRLELFKRNDFEQDSLRSNNTTINLLFVGRFVPNKKQDVLIYLLQSLRRNGFPGQLTLVGKGGGLYKLFLKILVSIFQLNKFVFFKEDLSQPELERIYKEADYLVVSSEHEGFCLPIFESLSRGLIPIARPISAMSELLAGTAILAEDDSIDSFVAKTVEVIRLTWKDPKNYLNVLNQSYAQVKTNFNSYMSADHFLDTVYQEASPADNAATVRVSDGNLLVRPSTVRTNTELEKPGALAKAFIQFFAYLNKQTSFIFLFAGPYYLFLVIRKIFSMAILKTKSG